MAGADATPSVAVEVLVERHQVAPVRIPLEQLDLAEHGAAAVVVAQEYALQAPRDVGRDLPQRRLLAGARRCLDQKVVAVVVVKLLNCLDEQEIDRKPD